MKTTFNKIAGSKNATFSENELFIFMQVFF